MIRGNIIQNYLNYKKIIIIHHSFNMPVPLRVGRVAPMFVLSFFLHSVLFAGSIRVSFQFLRAWFIISLHAFLGLPRPQCPSTSSTVMLLIQPSFLETWPSQRKQLYLNYVCMLLIPRSEPELMQSFRETLYIHQTISGSLCSNFRRSLTLGPQHSLTYDKTSWIYMQYICPHVVYERAQEVNIGINSWNLHHANWTLVITLRSQTPPAPILFPR